MPEILEYRSRQPPRRSPSRGTLARASMVLVLLACTAEASLLAVRHVTRDGEGGVVLALALGILVFTTWFLGVVFGIVAIVDDDGPRTLARNALLVAAAQAVGTLLIPI